MVDNLLINKFELVREFLDVVFSDYLEAPIRECILEFCILEQDYTVFCESFRISCMSSEPIVFDDLADSFFIDSDDREPERHSFYNGNPLCLGRGSGQKTFGANE